MFRPGGAQSKRYQDSRHRNHQISLNNLMSKSPFVALLLLLFSLPAVAQTTSYSIDNFDFQHGVRVSEPPANPKVAPSKFQRSKANRKAAPANTDPASLTPTLSSPLIQPTVLANPTSDTSPLRGFTTGNSQVDGFLVDSGNRNGIDPLLLYSVMHQESSFKSHAVSPKGARGL